MEKIKNLSALRLVAFAVAVAILLGLSSLMFSFTACAETADDVVSQLGTLGNYDCIKFKAGQKIDFMTLYNRAQSLPSTYVYGAIFGYKDGKFTSFTNNNVVVRPSSDGAYKDILFCGKTVYGAWLLGDKSVYDTAYSQFGLFQSNYCGMWVGVKDNVPTILGATKLAASSQDFYEANGETMYLVYTGSNVVWDTQKINDFINDIINNLTDSNYKDFNPPPTGGSENGRFICFGNYKEYTYDEHLADILSESIEYTKPTNKNTYWGRGTCYFRDDSVSTYWSSNRVATKQIIEYASTEIAFSYFNDSDDLGACSVRLSLTEPRFMEREVDTPLENPIKYLVQHKLSYFHHARNVVISCDSFRNIPANSTMTAKFDLTGFVPLGGASYVLLELVDTITGNVVSSVMIHSPVNNGKVSKDNDKIDVNFGYKEGNTTDIDINEPDDTGHLNGVPGGGLDDSNRKFVSNYENASISDIFGTLDSSVNSISDFFQMTWGLLPFAISTIIIGGFAILILLRILGR